MKASVLTALLAVAMIVADPSVAACDSDYAREFDFFIGEWTVEQRIRRADDGWIELAATTSVVPAAGGCALVENWRGEVLFFWTGMEEPAPLHGLSVRSWDPAADEWQIHWLDSSSPVFGEPFRGRFERGVGTFYRATDNRIDRITFEHETESSLDWELAVSEDGGERWRSLWTMTMTRRR